MPALGIKHPATAAADYPCTINFPRQLTYKNHAIHTLKSIFLPPLLYILNLVAFSSVFQTNYHLLLICNQKLSAMQNLIISNLDYSRIRMRMAMNQQRDDAYYTDVEKRISELDKARIIEPSEIPENVVTMNSKIMIRDLNHNRTYRLQLVYPEDADPKKNRISIFSPLATTLLGNKTGDIVTWKAQNGTIKVKIECILYQPEAFGDYHL